MDFTETRTAVERTPFEAWTLKGLSRGWPSLRPQDPSKEDGETRVGKKDINIEKSEISHDLEAVL